MRFLDHSDRTVDDTRMSVYITFRFDPLLSDPFRFGPFHFRLIRFPKQYHSISSTVHRTPMGVGLLEPAPPIVSNESVQEMFAAYALHV